MAEYECAYCGETREATDDHVPAKLFFAGSTQLPLRTVKACGACNGGASKDDEYLRDAMASYHRVGDLPQAQRIVEKMLRAATIPARRRYTEHFLAAMRPIPVYSREGVVIGHRDALTVDESRLRRVITRYARGLHRYEVGSRVPHDAQSVAVVNPDAMHEHADAFLKAVAGWTLRVVQDGVFMYAWKLHPERPGASSWLMIFFEEFPVLVSFRPPASAS